MSVSGPAAGLSTVVAAAIISTGSFEGFLVSIVIAGLFQISLGLIKAGGLVNLFPSAVIKGMLAAIGIILFSKQLPMALGYDSPDFWSSGFLTLFTSSHVVSNFITLEKQMTTVTICLSIASLVILILFNNYLAKRFKYIPSALVVVLIISLVAYLLPPELSMKIHKVDLADNFFSKISTPDFSVISNLEVWKNGITIGLLASLESLLCTEAVDRLDPLNKTTPVNRELIAQGTGNLICGLIGAIPLTAVIVRGAANIDAGARTKMSAITHGLLLFILVAITPFLLNKIPLACLASILIITGYRLAAPKIFKSMFKSGWNQFIPFIATIICILLTDLLIGVGIGFLLSTYFIVRTNYRQEFILKKEVRNQNEVITIKLHSNVNFLNKVKLRETLRKIKNYSIVTIDGSECSYVDFDILELIADFKVNSKSRHIEVHLIEIEEVAVMGH